VTTMHFNDYDQAALAEQAKATLAGGRALIARCGIAASNELSAITITKA